MFDFFKKKQLSEYTDDEIRDKLSSVLSPDTNPNYINNIINLMLRVLIYEISTFIFII